MDRCWRCLPLNLDADLIKAAIVLVILVLTGLGQLISKLQQQKPPLARPPRPEPPDDAAASERDRGIFASAPPDSPARIAPVVATVVAEPAAATRSSQAAARKAAEENAEEPVGDEVVKHVEKFLDAGEFSRRTSKLGGEVIQADAQLDQRLKQTFGHDVGRLSQKGGETACAPAVEEPAEAAAPVFDFAALFTNPVSFRQAILASEILRRPEERWAVTPPGPLSLRERVRVRAEGRKRL